jgi:hypothetical protein
MFPSRSRPLLPLDSPSLAVGLAVDVQTLTHSPLEVRKESRHGTYVSVADVMREPI